MSIAQSLLPEFDHEMASTRKAFERLPEDKLVWKPDPKSMTMGRLAGHIAEMPGWVPMTLTTDSLDINPVGGSTMTALVATSREHLLREFDRNVTSARAALAVATDQAMLQNWELLSGGSVMFSMPRVGVLRTLVMNHLIHHRGQLMVYFRLNGVQVPGLYGPSADEGQAASA